MIAHKDIRELFSVTHPKTGEVRRYEAVGFLNEGEPSTDGDDMLRRVAGENGGAIGEEDGKFLDECVDLDWLGDVWSYYLVTNWCKHDYLRLVRCFTRHNGKWNRSYDYLDCQWYDLALVVRRCA